MRQRVGIAAVGIAALVAIIALVSGSSSSPAGGAGGTSAASTTTTPGATTTTDATGTTAPTSTEATAPPLEARYVVPDGEVEREAKQLASDIAYALTTYERTDDPLARFWAIAGVDGSVALAEAGEPLTHRGWWSRGLVLYPQLGGLTSDKTSVMVVTRQTVGTGLEPSFSVVRTLDIRLIMGDDGWELVSITSVNFKSGATDNIAMVFKRPRETT